MRAAFASQTLACGLTNWAFDELISAATLIKFMEDIMLRWLMLVQDSHHFCHHHHCNEHFVNLLVQGRSVSGWAVVHSVAFLLLTHTHPSFHSSLDEWRVCGPKQEPILTQRVFKLFFGWVRARGVSISQPKIAREPNQKVYSDGQSLRTSFSKILDSHT